MKFLLFFIAYCTISFGSILETGLVGLGNDSVNISSGAEFYAYLNKLGDKNLSDAYREVSQPIDRLENPYLYLANVQTYEEAFHGLRQFYKSLYDKNSVDYIENNQSLFLEKRKLVVDELLDAKRKQFTDETIVSLLIKYETYQREIDILDLQKDKMYETAVLIVKRILKREYDFKYNTEDLNQSVNDLNAKIKLEQNQDKLAIYSNELLILNYRINFINTMEMIQKVNQNNNWAAQDKTHMLFMLNSQKLTTTQIKQNDKLFSQYQITLEEANTTINESKENNAIAEIIFHYYGQAGYILEIKHLLKQLHSAWTQAKDISIFVFNNNAVQVLDIVDFIQILITTLILQWLIVTFLKYKMNYGVGHLSIFITKLIVVCYLAYYFATQVLGLDATNLAMFASAFSIAIGFGMQSMIQNFVAGIILLGDKTIQVGDKIILSGGITGIVESITYRTTTIKTADNTLVMVPNSKLFLETVENHTKLDTKVRLRASLLVEHGSNLMVIEKIIIDSYSQIPGNISELIPIVIIKSMSEDGIYLEVRMFIQDSKMCDNETASRILYDALYLAKVPSI